jgi:hypothetical protein
MPTASRRKKDLDSNALSGLLVGNAEDGKGYELWILETESLVTSVHVIINEVIAEYSQECYADHLQSAAIKVAGHTAAPEDNNFLVGTCHRDDEDCFVHRTTRIDVIKEDIVAFRRLDSAASDETPEEKVSIHVEPQEDINHMTEDLILGHTSVQTLFDGTTRPAMRAHNPKAQELNRSESWWIISVLHMTSLPLRQAPVRRESTSTGVFLDRAWPSLAHSGAGQISLIT